MFLEGISANKRIFVLPSAQGAIDVLSWHAGEDVVHLSTPDWIGDVTEDEWGEGKEIYSNPGNKRSGLKRKGQKKQNNGRWQRAEKIYSLISFSHDSNHSIFINKLHWIYFIQLIWWCADQREDCRRKTNPCFFSIHRKVFREEGKRSLHSEKLCLASTVVAPQMCDYLRLTLSTLREKYEIMDAWSSKLFLYRAARVTQRWCGTHLQRKRLLYSCAHCADCELCLIGHDVSGLDVAVIHRVLESGSSVSVLMAHVTIEGNFGSSSKRTKGGAGGGGWTIMFIHS